MSTPAYGDAAGDGRVILVDTETLTQVVFQWRALLRDISLPIPQQLSEFPDPASSAVAAAMSGWPGTQEYMIKARDQAANEFVAAAIKASAVLTDSDQSGADGISRSVGPTPV